MPRSRHPDPPRIGDAAFQEGVPILHQPPRVPLFVDGNRTPAEAIRAFDGRPLYLVPHSEGPAGGELLAFTTQEAAEDELTRMYGEPPQDAPREEYGLGRLSLFQHINYGGAEIEFDWTQKADNLRRCSRGWNPFGGLNWNDLASSMRNLSHVVFECFEHSAADGFGVAFYAGPNMNYPWLGEWGFNDRISAVRPRIGLPTRERC